MNNHIELIPKNWSYIGDILKDSSYTQAEILLTYVVTWNVHGSKPTQDEMNLLLPKDKKYDLYIVNTQECLKGIGASIIGSSPKEDWQKILVDYFGDDYINVAYDSLASFQLSIFAHKDIYKDITDVKRGTISTGIMNIVPNKGAIGISFSYKSKSFIFINSHLCSGQDKSIDRNKDFERINNGLEMKPYVKDNKTLSIGKPEITAVSNMTITDKYDIAIWSGDFNYRINLGKSQVFDAIDNQDFEELREYDQFNVEVNFGRLNFNNFDEGIIYFNPTYKLKIKNDSKGKEEYDDTRIPGWCDRIIYKTKDLSDLLLCKYDIIQGTKSSDHKPVYAVFKIEINTPENVQTTILAKKNEKSAACYIF